ncbi:MAG: nucleotidyltransferase domain-containing protein [Spirochaetota bacterium]|nr:nucleotidyltransferase domain-containing protein [Spirochaetota bacterium]
MISEAEVASLIKVINSHAEAKKIILFGSYAQETMKSDSDIDILVEHESTFRERSVLPTIERAIAREGKVLYAA